MGLLDKDIFSWKWDGFIARSNYLPKWWAIMNISFKMFPMIISSIFLCLILFTSLSSSYLTRKKISSIDLKSIKCITSLSKLLTRKRKKDLNKPEHYRTIQLVIDNSIFKISRNWRTVWFHLNRIVVAGY